jgi:peptidoglycan L-alanyl-D-glutamate endopeptidase CwlK
MRQHSMPFAAPKRRQGASMKIDTLEPDFKVVVEKMISQLYVMGIHCVVTSARRTIAEQNKLYDQGRTKPGNIVTKAKGGQSAHNFGLAVDLCPLDKEKDLWWNAPDDVWNAMHRVGEQFGLRCGYDFTTIKDSPHFEAANWKAAQAEWKAGRLVVA